MHILPWTNPLVGTAFMLLARRGNMLTNVSLYIIVLIMGLVGGVLAASVGGVLWGLIVKWTEYEIGYMAVGLGLLCGFGVLYSLYHFLPAVRLPIYHQCLLQLLNVLKTI